MLPEELQQVNEQHADLLKALEEQQKTGQTQKNELERAYKLLEEKTRELELLRRYKSEFLANISHELRTPLNSVLVFSKILHENKNSNLTPKQVEFAHAIHAAGTELLRFIDEVLDLSALEAGDLMLHVEEMSLSGLSAYIEHTFRPVADRKNLRLMITFSEEAPASIRTDRQRVEQIMKNLLANALKFTTEGEVCIHIVRPPAGVDFSASKLDARHAIAISVTDTGVGIPQDKLSSIFETFQQADGTLTRKYEGAGLGLSVAKALAELLGGEIQVESEEGRGSTFTLYLPENLIVGGEIQETDNLSPPVPSPGIEAIRDDRRDLLSTDKSLLIIEDDPQPAKLLFDRAHERGFKCLLAGDGEAGLLLADQYQPTAIILNLGLPGMDGWNVMARLKEDLATRHIPVYFVSSQQKSLEALKMGAIGYQSKPITNDNLDDIFKIIEKSLTKTLRKLLVVQDEKMRRDRISGLLCGKKVYITTVTTLHEAYQHLNSDKFDCIVLDVGTMEMEVNKFLESLRQDTRYTYFPVIVYTDKKLLQNTALKLKAYETRLVLKWVTTQEQLLDEVTLFLHCAEADLPETQQNTLRMLHDKEAVLRGKTILMVDADMRDVFALSNILEEYEINVCIAESGKEAFGSLGNNPDIDLVLLDTVLPDMEGYEVMQQIRKNQNFRELPIIALSAKAKRGERQQCIKAGASEYLSKPVNTDKLLSLLRVWLY